MTLLSHPGVQNTRETRSLRVLYCGTPAPAASILESLILQGLSIETVITKPDRVDRRRGVISSPVKHVANTHGIPVWEPIRLDAHLLDQVRDLRPDVIIVCAYGKIFPKRLLQTPPLGCLNVHFSLLPQYRGASPVQEAILKGQSSTGITVMLMNEQMDEGDILSQHTITIGSDETTPQVMKKLADAAGPQLGETLEEWTHNSITPIPQDSDQATYCRRITKDQGHIDWKMDAQSIYNLFRAFDTWPGVFCFWQNASSRLRIKFLGMTVDRASKNDKPFGSVYRANGRVCIQTGSGSILPIIVQPEGKKPMNIEAFVNGRNDFLGSVLL